MTHRAVLAHDPRASARRRSGARSVERRLVHHAARLRGRVVRDRDAAFVRAGFAASGDVAIAAGLPPFASGGAVASAVPQSIGKRVTRGLSARMLR